MQTAAPPIQPTVAQLHPGTSPGQQYLLGLFRNGDKESDFQRQTTPPTPPGVIRNDFWDFSGNFRMEITHSKTAPPNATKLKPKQLHQGTRSKQKSL